MELEAKDLLTVEQAAQYLQVSQSSIRSYIRQGRLLAYRIAGKRKVLIPRPALLNLLEPARPDDVDNDTSGDEDNDSQRRGTVPMRENLHELWEARFLLRQFVVRTLKVRYKNSALGFFWSIVPPLLQVIVFTFMFRQVLNVRAENYSAYLLVGMIPWTFFQSAVLDASNSLKDNLPLIRKVYLPREIIPLSQVVSNFIHFMLAWIVYFVAFAFVARFIPGYGIPLLPSLLWFPVITFFLVLFTTGLSLWMAALHMFYDDIKFILQNVFQLLYFLIPVLYPADNVKYAGVMQQFPWLYQLYMLNPITALINAYRKTILEPLSPSLFNGKHLPNGADYPPVPLDYTTLGIACLISVLVAWGGYWYFCRRKWQFVEWG